MSGSGKWADILTHLSDKKSSIEAATMFALGKPDQAQELFAAVVAQLTRLQSVQHC